MEGGNDARSRDWAPFTNNEVQMALAVYSVGVTLALLADVEPNLILASSAAAAIVFYLAGLAIQAKRAARKLTFIPDGALTGTGYIPAFRKTKRSLFLMHVDDDPPCEELLATYRRLLREGVQIRRSIFVREDSDPAAYTWIEGFGEHEGLIQKVVRDREASATRQSFAIVDESTVLIAVPGTQAIDDAAYTPGLRLRHLLVMRDAEVARAFIRLHEQLWEFGAPLEGDESEA